MSSSIPSHTVWPDLPGRGFVAGRVATIGDVKSGNAAFAAVGKSGQALSTPTALDIPQYALHIDATNGVATPVIVIQAEKTPGGVTIGYRRVNGSGLGVCPIGEVRLMGKSKPQ